VAKIEQGLGGPNNAVNQVIQKYRAFAKAYPIAQSLIYAALIAAAGISGAGLGGAAVLGLLKMTDKLLQGEKFSSAAYSGAKTGAMAYGASRLGDLMKGKPDDIADKMAKGLTDKIPVDATNAATKTLGHAITAGKDYIAQGGGTDYASLSKAADAYYTQLDAMGVGADKANMLVSAFRTAAQGEAAKTLGGAATSTMGSALQAATNESVNLSTHKIATLFTLVQIKNRQFNEGLWDTIKNKAATVGKNLTTKVTADKLNSAWTKAGSPTDSDAVAKILQSAGVDPAVISKVYTDMSLPAPAGAVEPTLDQPTPAASGVNTKDLLAQILKLNPAEQQQVLAHLKK
jgi:hypothetical protein